LKEAEEKKKKEEEEKAKKEAAEKQKAKEQKEKEEKEKKSKLEQEKQKKLSLPKSQPPTTASKPSDSAKTPRIPGRRPLPTPSSAPPIKGYFAPATIKLESKLKDAVREFVNDAVLERVTELEERNAELEEELRFLRANNNNNNNNRPLSSSSTKLSRVDDSENARLRKQVASFKNQLDKIEIELDGIRPGRKSTNLSAGEKKTVEAVSMKLNQIRRQHPKLLEYAENVAESAQQNANDIKEKMSKHIDQVLTRVQKVNPLIDSDQFKQKEDYTQKRMFWEKVQKTGKSNVDSY